MARPFRTPLRDLPPLDPGIDTRLLRAMRHPLRYRIYLMLSDEARSPREVADELGEDTPKVANHFRVLLDLGLIELVRTERRHGGLAHVYRGVGDYLTNEQWAQLPLPVRRTVFQHTLELVGHDLARASANGGLDHFETHISRTPLALDQQGWEEVREIIDHALDEVIAANARASERRAHGESTEVIRTRAAFLHFHESAPGEPN